MAPRTPYGRVSPHPCADLWIVAGGPSARAFDLTRLHRCPVIAVNDALYRFSPSTTQQELAVAVSVDPYWIRRHRVFLSDWPGEKYFAVPLETWPDCAGLPGATYLQRCYEHGLSDDPAFVCTGGNSGYAAVNVAYLIGAHTIHLIGFDMSESKDKYQQWAPRFRSMFPQLQARGVRVVNHNPQSAIDAFPKEF